ncbi:MAG: hypothetical protein R3315_02855 [Woeseiaceae bacterium]|nr:hypothetical protein [Woeseiaceae bacterium]
MTEQEFDAESREALQQLDSGGGVEPDLSIDGLSESFLSRLLNLFSSR